MLNHTAKEYANAMMLNTQFLSYTGMEWILRSNFGEKFFTLYHMPSWDQESNSQKEAWV